MNEQDRNSEQRRSYRCPVADPQQAAELRVHRRRIPVRLFNESAGGFGAYALDRIEAKVGDVLELSNDAGRFEVRLAYLRELHDEALGVVYRVGLERVGDLTPMAQSRSWRVKCDRRMTSRISAIVVAGILVGAGVGALTMGKVDGSWLVKWARSQPAAKPAPAAAAARDAGNAAFAAAVRQLGLTRVEQVQLQSVAAETARALQAIDSAWKGDSPEERAMKQAMLLEAARQEVLNLLTDEQRTRWSALLP